MEYKVACEVADQCFVYILLAWVCDTLTEEASSTDYPCSMFAKLVCLWPAMAFVTECSLNVIV